MLAQESCITKFTALTIYKFFCEKVLFGDKNVISAACCMKFSWYVYVDPARIKNKLKLIFNVAWCSLLLQTVSPFRTEIDEPIFASCSPVCVFEPCNISPMCTYDMPHGVYRHLTIYRWDLIMDLNSCTLSSFGQNWNIFMWLLVRVIRIRKIN